MSRASRGAWRCLRLGAAMCVLMVMVDSAHSSAAPISPIPDGPQTIQLVTVPTVVGATFSLDGTLITTDQNGVAPLPISAARDLSRITLVTPGSGLGGGAAQFVRLTRAPDKDGLLRAYALFKISRDVSFTFRDSLGDALPAERVTSLTIRSSIGESFTLTGDALKHPISLPSERSVAFVNGDSAMKEIYYSVQEVVISGSNTVFRSQQKFFPIKTSSFEVETAFYTLTIKTSDSLFGFATGTNIVIRWPDQHISTAPIRNGRAVLPALPRGEYDMRIEGPGMKTWRPISVSRDQTVELELLSYLDGFVVLTIVLAIAATCVVVGRRRFGTRKTDNTDVTELPADQLMGDAALVSFPAPEGEPQQMHGVEPVDEVEHHAEDEVETSADPIDEAAPQAEAEPIDEAAAEPIDEAAAEPIDEAAAEAADQVDDVGESTESEDTPARENKPTAKKTKIVAKKTKTVAKRSKAAAKT